VLNGTSKTLERETWGRLELGIQHRTLHYEPNIDEIAGRVIASLFVIERVGGVVLARQVCAVCSSVGRVSVLDASDSGPYC